ncbi:MAG TPA: ATP-binding protein [Chryseolinea sp.]
MKFPLPLVSHVLFLVTADGIQRTRERKLEQKKEIGKANLELKATQKQLIQAEKMASPSELTAHEIQNLLNFVNNFSEVDAGMISEMTEETARENITELTTVAAAIAENGEKVPDHCKRANVVVKGMLHHSRNSDGQKEPTAINALAVVYPQLACEGILNTIFQPFFTTKPTGGGTGLGLSPSNDIITKVHGGKIKVDTVEGQETTFTIVLPV